MGVKKERNRTTSGTERTDIVILAGDTNGTLWGYAWPTGPSLSATAAPLSLPPLMSISLSAAGHVLDQPVVDPVSGHCFVAELATYALHRVAIPSVAAANLGDRPQILWTAAVLVLSNIVLVGVTLADGQIAMLVVTGSMLSGGGNGGGHPTGTRVIGVHANNGTVTWSLDAADVAGSSNNLDPNAVCVGRAGFALPTGIGGARDLALARVYCSIATAGGVVAINAVSGEILFHVSIPSSSRVLLTVPGNAAAGGGASSAVAAASAGQSSSVSISSGDVDVVATRSESGASISDASVYGITVEGQVLWTVAGASLSSEPSIDADRNLVFCTSDGGVSRLTIGGALQMAFPGSTYGMVIDGDNGNRDTRAAAGSGSSVQQQWILVDDCDGAFVILSRGAPSTAASSSPMHTARFMRRISVTAARVSIPPKLSRSASDVQISGIRLAEKPGIHCVSGGFVTSTVTCQSVTCRESETFWCSVPPARSFNAFDVSFAVQRDLGTAADGARFGHTGSGDDADSADSSDDSNTGPVAWLESGLRFMPIPDMDVQIAAVGTVGSLAQHGYLGAVPPPSSYASTLSAIVLQLTAPQAMHRERRSGAITSGQRVAMVWRSRGSQRNAHHITVIFLDLHSWSEQRFVH